MTGLYDVESLFAEAERLMAPPAPDAHQDPWPEPDAHLVERLNQAERPIVLAGPGVVSRGAVPGLHALAAAAHVGVLNTWGAKGVFHWRSRHHLATAGLQEQDFALGGLADADLIVATGIDPAEAGDGWSLAPTVEVAPEALAPLSEHWHRPPTPITVPPLRAGLARVAQEGWVVTSTPMPPSLATSVLSAVMGTQGFLAADAGTAGYWVARTYPTLALGTVLVPATARRGLAVACAAVARRDLGRPVLAIVDGPPDEALEALVDAAAERGAPLAVECWHDDGDALDADAYEARLRSLTHAEHATIVSLRVDQHQRAAMVEVAGPITAWPGLDMPRE